jgi:DNA-binding response OmpR family regulator
MVENSLSAVASLDWAKSIEEAKQLMEKVDYELVLLDIELPDGNGFDFCQELQTTHPTLPIFFLTSHDSLSEKVMGFTAGADDYITKPFNSLELRARVEAKLKKIAMLMNTNDLLKWQEIEIDKNSQEVFILEDGESASSKQSVDLTSLEFKILMYLCQKPNDVISRDQIMDSIWGKDVFVYARSVDTHISKLRKKLGSVSSIIESVHGVGYKFKPTPMHS